MTVSRGGAPRFIEQVPQLEVNLATFDIKEYCKTRSRSARCRTECRVGGDLSSVASLRLRAPIPLSGHVSHEVITFVAGVLEQSITRLTTPERKRDLPRLREHLWIFDHRFVIDGVLVDDREPFNHMQGIAVERQPVEPCLSVEVRRVDD